MKKKVVFITGPGHCGSTLLSLILGSHPDCLALGEFNSYSSHYRAKVPFCQICRGECDFWNRQFNPMETQKLAAVLGNTRLHPYIPLKLEKSFRSFWKKDQVFNPFSLVFSKCNEHILLDSSKNVNWIQQRLAAKEFQDKTIESYILHLVRDGRAVMSSYLRRFNSMNAEIFAKSWKNNTIRKRDLVTIFPEHRRMVVRYEELATQPQEIVNQICDWLEISFDPQMIQYWNHDHHIISGNSGVHSLIWKSRQEKIDEEVTKYQGDYYQEQGLNIKLDLRWKTELSLEQVKTFEKIAGDINQPYEWNN